MYNAAVSSSIGWLIYLAMGLTGAGALGIIATVIYRVARKGKLKGFRAIGLIVTFVIVAAAGLPIFLVENYAGGNATISVGNAYIQISAPLIGSSNYTASDIKYAFVENLNSGNITLSQRTDGTSMGSLNEGYFTLSSGHAANVVSDNLTSIVLETASGPWVVLGTPNTGALAAYINAHVHAVSGL